MQISKYLSPNLIKLEMETRFDTEENEDNLPLSSKRLLERKEMILSECVDLMDISGKVANKKKLLIDLFNREKQSSTALGKGIAVPHVRTMQAKELIISVCRSTDGYDFDAVDGEPVYIFVAMAAPPYDDNLYLKVFKSLAEVFRYEGFHQRIMEAQVPYDVIRFIKELE